MILGEGEKRDTHQDTIEKLDLGNNVILAGFTDNPFRLIGRSDLFVLSSIGEALPSVLIEALFLSAPCVSTDLPVSREILAPDMNLHDCLGSSFTEVRYGILTPFFCRDGIVNADGLTREERIMADAICYMLKNPDDREAIRSRTHEIKDKFEIDSIAKEWMGILA